MAGAKWAPFTWTDHNIDVLRAEWRKGRTASQIGDLLRTSRNSVIGKAHRLGLIGRPSPINNEKDYPNRRQKKPSIARLRPELVAPRGKPPFDWTLDKEERVRRGYAYAEPIADIAKDIGASSDTVMRLAKVKGWVHPRRGGTLLSVPEPVGLPALPAPVRSSVLVDVGRIGSFHLFDLQPGQCRWPVTGHKVPADAHRFCGAQATRHADGGYHPYCEAHKAKATRPMYLHGGKLVPAPESEAA